MEPLVLANPKVGKTLFIHLAVSDVTVSVVLFKEGEDGRQRPVFFVSKSLANAKTSYNHLEQATLALWVAAQEAWPIFSSTPHYGANKPSPSKHYTQARLVWENGPLAIELSEYGILYMPRLAKKGQVLANFLAEVP